MALSRLDNIGSQTPYDAVCPINHRAQSVPFGLVVVLEVGFRLGELQEFPFQVVGIVVLDDFTKLAVFLSAKDYLVNTRLGRLVRVFV